MANIVDPVGVYAYGEVLTEYVSVNGGTPTVTGVTCIVIGQDSYEGNDYLYIDNIKGGSLGYDTAVTTGTTVVGNVYTLKAEQTLATSIAVPAEVKLLTGTSASLLLPTELRTTNTGRLFGTFNIPNNSATSFRTGTRQLKFSDSSSNDPTQERTSGTASYSALGSISNMQKTVLSTRTAKIVSDTITSDNTITTLESNAGRVNWFDPLAQTFLVDLDGGAFVTDVDLFFSTKDTVLPVRIEIREVVNGYPGAKILPFSNVVLPASSVKVDEFHGQIATNFKFRSPVFLQSGNEYALCIFSDSSKYKVWIAQIGEFEVAKVDGTTSGLITTQPYAGVLFKSQNASTWTADQTQDLKFQLNRAVFDTTAAALTLVNQNVAVNVGYDLAQISVSNITPAGTSISATYSGSTIQLDENIYMASRSTLTAGTGGFTTVVNMSSTMNNLSPVVDLSRCAATLVANSIENVGVISGSDNETAATGGTAAAKYVTKQVNLNNSASNLRIMFNTNVPLVGTVNVYYKVAGGGATNDFNNKIYTLATATTPFVRTTNLLEFNQAEYLIENLAAFDVVKVKLVMKSSNSAMVPRIKDLRIIAYA